jgi:hypothetical protein
MWISKGWILNYLHTNQDRKDKVQNMVGKALVALWQRQTEVEQAHKDTKNKNHRGFSIPDARDGSLFAEFFQMKGYLEWWMVERWTRPQGKRGLPRLCKYARQLNEVHQEKFPQVDEDAAQLTRLMAML